MPTRMELWTQGGFSEMRLIIRRKIVVFPVLCCTMLLQVQPILAADPPGTLSPTPATAAPEALDATIQTNGFLYGQVVDEQGAPNAAHSVKVTRLTSPQGVVATVYTDREGRFQVADVSGGVYSFQTGESADVYRLWTGGNQPPSAATQVRLVRRPLGREHFFSNLGPGAWACIGVGVAAAIALPIALTRGHTPASGS